MRKFNTFVDFIHYIYFRSIFFRQDPFYVPHINWTGWKDHLAPDEADDTIELLRIAKATAKGKSIVVHCSAGIGNLIIL